MAETSRQRPNGEIARRSEQGRILMHRSVFLIHVLQLPLYFGLMLALIVFGATFFYAIFDAVEDLEFLDRNAAILLVLDLLDMVFIANLVVMVMVSGYNAYAAAARNADNAEAQITFSDEFAPVKARIAATLVIISGIHIVHEVLSENRRETIELVVLGGLHLVLLLSAVGFAWIARHDREDDR